MKVVVLGASPNPERYSNKAIRQLKAHGHAVVPVNPAHNTIEGLSVVPQLAAVQGPVDTLTVYVGPQHIEPMLDDLVALRPKRVIINPGAESAVLRQRLDGAGIDYVEACTLVMLATGQF
jgi:predicted CoA-binding protein